MIVHVVNKNDDMIMRTFHEYLDFKRWNERQRKPYRLKLALSGAFKVLVDPTEVID